MIKVLAIPYTEFPVHPTEAFPDLRKRDYPVLPVSIAHKEKQISFLSVIDSGADNCVFPAVFGRAVGLDIEAGKKLLAAGVAGGGVAYFHSVEVSFKIQDKQYSFDCYCGFMTSMDQMGIGLLGRHGFFNLFEKVSFNNKARLVELEALHADA